MNEYDSERIYDIAKKINYKRTEDLNETNCYVLNTCHIREKATEKVYHDVGRLKKPLEIKKTNCYSNWLCGTGRGRNFIKKRKIH